MTFPVGEAAALSCAALWASTSILFAAAGRQAPPVATNLFKSAAATVLFTAVLLLRDGTPVPREVAIRDVLVLALSGLAGLSVADSLLYLGFQVVGTRQSNLLMSMAPIFGAVGGAIWLGESLGVWAGLGMAVALVGVTVVVSDRMVPLPDGRPRRVQFGIVLGLGSAVGQAVGALLAKSALERVPTLEATQIRVAAGAVGLLLYAILRGQVGHWWRRLLVRPVLWRLLVASVLGPFAGIWLMVVALDRTVTGVALTLITTTPIWLLVFAAVLKDDRPSGRETAGAMIAVGGIAILLLR